MTFTLVPPPAEWKDTALPTEDEEPDVEVAHLRAPTPLQVSVVFPALNEERNIGWVLDALPADLQRVILVRGQSVDRTVATAHEHQRCYGESNLATWRDGYRLLRAVIKKRSFRPTGAAVFRHLRRYPMMPQLHFPDGEIPSQIGVVPGVVAPVIVPPRPPVGAL
jgi:hypothetical protein